MEHDEAGNPILSMIVIIVVIAIPILAWFLGTIFFVGVLVAYFLIFFAIAIAFLVPGPEAEEPAEVDLADMISRSRSPVWDGVKEAQQRARDAELARLEAMVARSDPDAVVERIIKQNIAARHATEFADEVWAKIWATHSTETFTTDDVIALGNTVTDANNVLTDLKDRGVLKTTGLREFELLKGPGG